jgi:class 3 adenylate cyclase
VNCTVLLTDVVGFGALNRSDQDRQIIRNSVLGMVQELLGPVWEACAWEDRGDGLLIVAPPQVPTARIMESVHRTLPGWLRLHNQTYNESARIRLRIAVNVGPVIEDSLGMAGDAIIRTARLVDAPALKKAMAVTGAAMGIIVSEFVYETVVMRDLINSDEYKMIEVSVKESRRLAWMRLLEAGPPALRAPLPER